MITNNKIMKAIILVGKLGSGKSVVAQRIRDNYNYDVFEIGDLVREDAKNNSELLPLEYAEKVFELYGRTHFVKKIISLLNKTKTNVIVGVRTIDELRLLRNSIEKVYIIGLIADYSIREKRYELSKQSKVKNSSFMERNKKEENWEISKVLLEANVTIDNSFSYERLLSQIDKIMILCNEYLGEKNVKNR